MSYSKKLIAENVARGVAHEPFWIGKLKSKYPTIISNNITNKFSKMDAMAIHNGQVIEFEHKKRNCNHNTFVGLMVNESKLRYSIEQLKKNVRQIYFWSCKDGIFFWELKDFEKQKHELIFGQNSNKKIGQPQVDIVDIKTKYLQRFLIT